jgi:ubiquitin carboxyl-terminal hydrolase 34
LKASELESEERLIIEHSIVTIIVIVLHNQDLLVSSMENQEFINILFSGIFTDKSDTTRNLFSRAILVLCHESQKRTNQPTRIILQ